MKALDDLKLAEQWAKTGSFMDLCLDEEWVREAARIEDECDGRIEAGPAMRAYAAAKYDDSLADARKSMRQQMRVQSILFVELKRWMMEWGIGIAFEEIYTEARELVRAHLKQPSPELAEWVEAVLAEEDQAPQNSDRPVRAQARAQLFAMMTDEDCETLAQVAAKAAAAIVLKASKRRQQASVAA